MINPVTDLVTDLAIEVVTDLVTNFIGCVLTLLAIAIALIYCIPVSIVLSRMVIEISRREENMLEYTESEFPGFTAAGG